MHTCSAGLPASSMLDGRPSPPRANCLTAFNSPATQAFIKIESMARIVFVEIEQLAEGQANLENQACAVTHTA